jgi:hypothetical protein
MKGGLFPGLLADSIEGSSLEHSLLIFPGVRTHTRPIFTDIASSKSITQLDQLVLWPCLLPLGLSASNMINVWKVPPILFHDTLAVLFVSVHDLLIDLSYLALLDVLQVEVLELMAAAVFDLTLVKQIATCVDCVFNS